jgi:general secretion pathway protein L
MKVLGVDLGQYSVKVAELEVTSKGSVLNGFYEFPLSPDPQRDRALETLEILRRVSSQFGGGAAKWIVGVPQNRVSVHNKRFPFKERAKIQKSLAFELEDDIPLDIDDTIFDAKIIEYHGRFTDRSRRRNSQRLQRRWFRTRHHLGRSLGSLELLRTLGSTDA